LFNNRSTFVYNRSKIF